MIKIRTAQEEDAEELLGIYAPYVEQTAVTFEYEVPSVVEFTERIRNTLQKYPYLVAETPEGIVGYAYASAFHERAAYGWGAELSIYVKCDQRGIGVGQQLYNALEEALKKQGFQMAAHFHQCGYKLGEWYDMVWMEKMLGPHENPPQKIAEYSEI